MDESRIAMFKEVLKDDPNDPLLYFGLGQEYMGGEQFAQAIESFENAVRLHPDYSAAYRYLGECLEKAGDQQRAREVYEVGIPVAEKHGDLEAAKAMRAFLKRVKAFRGSPKKIVCECLEVTEAQVLDAIRTHKLNSVKDIAHYTEAGKGCTACHGLLREYLEHHARAT